MPHIIIFFRKKRHNYQKKCVSLSAVSKTMLKIFKKTISISFAATDKARGSAIATPTG